MIVVASGANFEVSPEDVEAAAEAIRASKVVLTQLETPLPAVRRLLELAHQSGVPTILNPAPGQALDRDLLALVDIITPNQTEAGLITGVPSADPESAAAALRDHGAHTVVMTLGGDGVLLVDEEGPHRFPAFPVEHVVDTTGAGDAFNGALAVALAEGRALPDAIRFASATGAISVTRPGRPIAAHPRGDRRPAGPGLIRPPPPSTLELNCPAKAPGSCHVSDWRVSQLWARRPALPASRPLRTA